VLTPEMAWVIGGTAVAEIVFGTPGLSERVTAAVAGRDYPVLQAYAALTAGLVLGARTCAQLLADRLDPRRRA
jgi:peptide/nickel transport system permease protein